MTDEELEALAVKCGIYWVGNETAYMHADTMRTFADALQLIERERCVKVIEDFAGGGPQDFDYPGVHYAIKECARLVNES
jgi:hypothetical protein